MGKQHLSRDDRIFMRGKLQGTRECMDMVAMVLMDKCGWHVQEETPDSRDTHLTVTGNRWFNVERYGKRRSGGGS